MIVRAFFLQRAIKSLAVRIHLGGAWSRVIVRHMLFEKQFCEVHLKLTAIIGKYGLDRYREHLLPQSKELCSCRRCVRGDPERKGVACMEVNSRHNVALHSMYVLFDGVKGNAVSYMGCLEVFGLA